MIEDSDNDMNNNTLMKIAEKIQDKYGSRQSKPEHPLLILIFLPMGQNIKILQETLMRFIKENKLFNNFHYDASCSSYKLDDDADKKFLKRIPEGVEIEGDLKEVIINHWERDAIYLQGWADCINEGIVKDPWAWREEINWGYNDQGNETSLGSEEGEKND